MANSPKLKRPPTPLNNMSGSSSVVKARAPADNAAPIAIAETVTPTMSGPANSSRCSDVELAAAAAI